MSNRQRDSTRPIRIDTVNNAKTSTNATEVRSFLGVVNFCSQFAKGYATLKEPLK